MHPPTHPPKKKKERKRGPIHNQLGPKSVIYIENKIKKVQIWLLNQQAVQFSSVPWLIRSSAGHDRGFSRDPLLVFSAEGRCEQFWHGRGCPHFDAVHLVFPLPNMASLALEAALKDGSGQDVVACDMPEPCRWARSQQAFLSEIIKTARKLTK